LVVLNYNGREHVRTCLDSLLALDYPKDRLELIFCDNASADDSVELVRRQYPTVRLLVHEENHGFAEGNNRAARSATGDWVGFLNNDMQVEKSWLRELVDEVGRQPGLACISSKILNWDGTAIDFIGSGVNFQGFGFQVDYGLKESPQDRPRRLLCPCGGAMLIRRELFLEVGGFDPDYFGFYEDTDLGWRLNLLGHDVWYTPKAVVFHRHHGSFDSVRAEKRRLLYERNSLFTMYKCLEAENLAVALPVSLLLLNEKALSMASVDRSRFRIGTQAKLDQGGGPRPAADRTYAFDPGAEDRETVIGKAGRVLRTHGPLTVLRRGRRYLGARAGARWRKLAQRIAGSPLLPPASIAHYIALSDFTSQIESLTEKRRWLQERRVRSDEELLPLFLFALEPSYHDDEYVRTHRRLVSAFGLDRRFGAGQRQPA
jgi:GT2 family glycosyltransferase